MAQLFKKKLLKTKLENFVVPDLEVKIKILQKWVKALKDRSLYAKTESQCEQAFNQDIFVTILGYKMFPDSPYTIDPKANTEVTGQKPDAALGVFTADKKSVQVVCEIKDAHTSLDKSQNLMLAPKPIEFVLNPPYDP